MEHEIGAHAICLGVGGRASKCKDHWKEFTGNECYDAFEGVMNMGEDDDLQEFQSTWDTFQKCYKNYKS